MYCVTLSIDRGRGRERESERERGGAPRYYWRVQMPVPPSERRRRCCRNIVVRNSLLAFFGHSLFRLETRARPRDSLAPSSIKKRKNTARSRRRTLVNVGAPTTPPRPTATAAPIAAPQRSRDRARFRRACPRVPVLFSLKFTERAASVLHPPSFSRTDKFVNLANAQTLRVASAPLRAVRAAPCTLLCRRRRLCP